MIERGKALPTNSRQLTVVTLAVVVLTMCFLFLSLAAREKANLVESKRAAAAAVADLFSKAMLAPLDLFDDESAREQMQHLRSNPEVRGVSVWRSEQEKAVVEFVAPGALRMVRPDAQAIAHESVQEDVIVVVRPIVRDTSGRPGPATANERVGVAAIEFSLEASNEAIRSSRLRILALAAGLALFLAVVIGGVQRSAMLAQERVNAELNELNSLKDEFLANTSHELRTPLNGIIGLTEALLDDGSLNTNTRRNLAMIGTSGRRLANLVNDILDFSKLEDRELVLQRRRLDVASIARRVITLTTPLLGKKPVSLSCSMGATAPHVYADANRVEQVLLNLVGNAVKFTERGSISIRTSLDRDYLAIHVQDTGIGIAEQNHSSIFKSFQQGDGSTARKYGGTGLGLSVTKKLVELHGGTLTVKSAPGQGSTFTFTLPLAADTVGDEGLETGELATSIPALDGSLASASGRYIVADVSGAGTAKSDPPKRSREAGGATRVLVVDDEPVNRAVLTQQLESRGYQIHEATDGVEAVEWITRNGAPDVVLLDVMMPRMNGYETLRTLRDSFPKSELPVLLLTAKNRESDVAEGFRSGANDYVTKPFTRTELEARVEHHLQLKRTSEELHDELGRRRDLEGSIAALTSQEAAAHAKLEVVGIEQKRLEGDLQAAERQLVQLEKLATLGEAVASVAHEIGNPIGYISSSADLIGMELDELDEACPDLGTVMRHSAAIRSSIDDIQTGVEKVRELSQAMRNVGRVDDVPTDDASLLEIARESLLILAGRTSGFTVTNAVDAAHLLRCHRSHIGQAIMNLVANGCDALREHREKHGHASCGRVQVASERAADGTIIVVVEDDGPGVPESLREKVLMPFFTTKAVGVGTGLGLAVVQKIAAEHGGRLAVSRSTALGGARFELHVPPPSSATNAANAANAT